MTVSKGTLVVAVMTPFPWSVDVGSTAGAARARMEAEGFRHLPVTRRGELVGVLSRDVATVVDDGTPVGEVASKPYVVEDQVRLATALAGMAAHHTDAALVTRDGKLVGIFTSTDVCRLMAGILGAPSDGRVA